jgi:hypothetical protein
VKVGHFHDDVCPSHFAKVVMSHGLELLLKPEGFRRYIGQVPKTIMLKTNASCSWMVKVREVDGKISMDQGWAGFAIAQKIKIGYFMTFKVLKDDAYKVAIFDYSVIEIVKKCPQHDPSPCHDARVKAGTGNLC